MFEFATLLERYGPALAGGALVTFELATIIWAGGLLLGVGFGVLRAALPGRGGAAVSVGALAASSIPILVYLLWAYYPLQTLLGVAISPFWTAAFVFTIYNGLVISELIRGGIEDLPIAYRLAARVNGIAPRVYFRVILFPLVFRRLLPAYLASQVVALHLTLFASLISVDELFRVTQRINAIEYNAVSSYSLLALFYFLLSFPLYLGSRWAARKIASDGLDR